MRNMYQEIIEEGNEILEKGITHLRRNVRVQSLISPVKDYAPYEIKAIRERNQYSQAFFSEYLGVPLKTIQEWESGTNKPTGTALRIFQILEHDSHALDKFLLLQA